DTATALFADPSGEVGTILPAGTDDLASALDYLFGPAFSSPDRENAVVLGLVQLSRTNPEIADVLTTAYTATRLQLADLVAQGHPDASPDACLNAAYGVLTCALGSVFLGDFDADPTRTARSRAAADALIAAL
ncbi:MAG TPA: TetR/AcrR family transcriptional regulator, partial [Agromyces sp.]